VIAAAVRDLLQRKPPADAHQQVHRARRDMRQIRP
jgi:hypothetical protein